MRATYSPEIDALAFWLAPGAVAVGAKEIVTDTYADFDKDGRLLGIEILNASTHYNGTMLEILPRPQEENPGTTRAC